MTIFVVLLALVAGLVALGGAIATLFDKPVPPLLVGGLLALPLVVAVAWARAEIVAGIHDAMAGPPEMMTVMAAGRAALAWESVRWPTFLVTLAAPLPVLVAAVGGAMRGPRRWWPFGLGISWTLLCLVCSIAALAMGGRDISPSAIGFPPAIVVFGLAASVAFLAGGEKGGPSAAGIAGTVAAVALVAVAMWPLVMGQILVLKAVATAPPDLRITLFAGGQSLEGFSRPAALVTAVSGLGFAALGLGVGERWSAAFGTAAAAVVLPLLVLGCDTTTLMADTLAAPTTDTADVQLPGH